MVHELNGCSLPSHAGMLVWGTNCPPCSSLQPLNPFDQWTAKFLRWNWGQHQDTLKAKTRSTKGSIKRCVVSLTVFISSKLSSVRDQRICPKKNWTDWFQSTVLLISTPPLIDDLHVGRRFFRITFSTEAWHKTEISNLNWLWRVWFFNRWRFALIPPFLWVFAPTRFSIVDRLFNWAQLRTKPKLEEIMAPFHSGLADEALPQSRCGTGSSMTLYRCIWTCLVRNTHTGLVCLVAIWIHKGNQPNLPHL